MKRVLYDLACWLDRLTEPLLEWWYCRESYGPDRPPGHGWCLAPASAGGGYECRFVRFPWCRSAWPAGWRSWLFFHTLYVHILGHYRFHWWLIDKGFLDSHREGGAVFWRVRFWRSNHVRAKKKMDELGRPLTSEELREFFVEAA